MVSSIRVRAATLADLDQILAFIQQKAAFDGFQAPLVATADRLQQTLFGPDPCAEVAFAEVAETAVGFILFTQLYSSFLAQSTLWIDDLFVLPKWRRQGIGRALLKYVAALAKTRHCERIEWTVATQNDAGIQFYQQQGAQIRTEVRLCRLNAQTIATLVQAEEQEF
jgi:GNAT superfamily N-acetyltransferase